MKKYKQQIVEIVKIVLGCAMFGLGFSVFLTPCNLNTGGLTGLAMTVNHVFPVATIGTISALINLPLFLIGGLKIGRKFFFSSLLGMVLSSTFVDLCALIPPPDALDPLMGALYGGVICGLGLGMVFSTGGSTGGSDIIVRLLKLKYQNVPIGIINTCFDLCVAVLTGLVFWDLKPALYSGVAIFVTGRIVDAVVYRFDYSKVAIIVTDKHQVIAKEIGLQLKRGSTFLQGQGAYSGKDTKVILTAVKRQQVAELKQLVVEIDPAAFIIVQEAHQVLGDGFSRYSKFSL